MLSVDDTRARMLAAIMPLAAEDVLLEDAPGRVLAQAIIADRAQPPFASSAMDGYALRAADTPGDLHVVGESAAGRAYSGTLGAGETVRISTGAPVPSGADAIVLQEDATRDGDRVTVPDAKPGRHIRPRGGDFDGGATLLPAGRVLDTAALTLAAAAGRALVAVTKRPRVTLLSGGDEIATPGTTPRGDQVFDSTRFGVAALVRGMGGLDRMIGALPDEPAAIERALSDALEHSDLVVMIGGASVGPHDHARPAAKALGATFLVDKVSVRPGKPTWFAVVRGKPVLGLPGNPASALVTACLFLASILARLQGADTDAVTSPSRARLVGALPDNGPREHYLRAVRTVDSAGVVHVRALEDQDSSLMTVAAAANALLVRPAGDPARAAGDLVHIMPFTAHL